jgi:hypothetical protein
MELPVIWNPHDPSSPLTNASDLSPSEFRVVAESAAPDPGAPSNSFFVCGYSQSQGAPAGPASSQSQFSYAADQPNSPGAAAPGSTANTWYADPSKTGSGIKKTFDDATTEINLKLVSGAKTLFPEPAVLMRPGNIQDSNGNTFNVSLPTSQNWMRTDPAVKGFFDVTKGGLRSYMPNALGMQSGEFPNPSNKPNPGDPINTPYVGFYLGAFPLAWYWTSPSDTTKAPISAANSSSNGCYLSLCTNTPGNAGNPAGDTTACYMTYRIEYKDPNGGWVTYDTKYGKVTNGKTVFYINVPSLICGVLNGKDLGRGGYWASATDPRTSRFGLFWNATDNNTNGLSGIPRLAASLPAPEFDTDWGKVGVSDAGWLDVTNGIIYTTRPDANTGIYLSSGWPFAPNVGEISGWMAYAASNGSDTPGIAPGLLSQNNTDIPYEAHRFYGAVNGNDLHTPNYFADPDGMVRRGMGAFVPSGTTSSPTYNKVVSYNGGPSADTTVGLPMARAFDWNNKSYKPSNPNLTPKAYDPSSIQPTSQAQSRPYFLHRPFYSVAELGYVFSDTPWRNLDFFTAESGSAALLDVFCINDTDDANGLVAGKVNLNSAQAPVLQAVLAGAYLDPVQPGSGGATGRLNTATARAVANALVARLNDTTNISNGTGRLRNVSELVGKWVANKAIAQLPAGGSPAGLHMNRGTLDSSKGFYDGKLSYAGFSGGVWDNTSSNLGATSRKPFVNGVENFSSSNGAPKPTGTAMDIYSAYAAFGSFSPNGNGNRETASYIQRFREAPIRALASAGQTRVWNLMIDVVAQTGRFPQSATAFDKFMAEGEQRYWVHVAIDRYTGQVIDKQIEVVKE